MKKIARRRLRSDEDFAFNIITYRGFFLPPEGRMQQGGMGVLTIKTSYFDATGTKGHS